MHEMPSKLMSGKLQDLAYVAKPGEFSGISC